MKTLLVPGFVCCMLTTAARSQVVVVYPPQPQPSTVVMMERPVPVPVERFNAYLTPQPTTYLIALNHDDIRIAEQYWVKNGTLYYLMADHQERTVPVDSLDLALTMRLNSERNVAFSLPAGQERTAARSRVVHHTASVVHKRCYCTVTRSARATSPAGRASRAIPAPQGTSR